MSKPTLSERVIEARVYFGLSQEDAAKLIGISLAELQQLENQSPLTLFEAEHGVKLIDGRSKTPVPT